MLDLGSKSTYRHLCEHLGVALIATDKELTIRAWNAAASRLFGAGAERMIGTPVSRIVPQGRRRTAEKMLRRAIDTGETIELEFQHRDTQGRRREMAGTIAPIPADSGERIGASICIRDITRRIELQDALHESRKMGALGEMAGAIAHHFNNILGGVVTSIDYANASEDSAVRTRVLEQIGPALQRATTLVDGLLAFAEGDRRVDDLSDFTELINHLAEETEREIAGRSIAFTLNLPALPVLCIPRVPVSTALRNIVQNALEAMPKGGALTIDVALDDRNIEVRVRDTGCGLDEAAKSRVFEPFWTTKEVSVNSSHEATGQGLAIAHGLVQMIGGSITVTSETGQGACFCVTIPRTTPA